MKIKDGLNLSPNRHGRIEIPDCCRNDLRDFFVDMGFKVGVEIGVYRGEFTKKLCHPKLKIYGIDPWKQYKDYFGDRVKYPERCEQIYQEALKRVAPYNCELIRKTSVEAAKDFEDENLDFVYIDGNHQLKYVIEDIHEWLPKIKKGGIISGHDYAYGRETEKNLNILEVRYAVDTYTDCKKIRPWYVLGSLRPKEGEKRDRFRSWMWFKK